MNTQPGGPVFHRAIAGQAETGRACPYCRFPLKEGVAIAVCGACGAAHHDDCWQDNGGCAVIACAGGPAAATANLPGEAGAAPVPSHPAPPAAPHPAAPAGGGAPPASPLGPSMWPPPQPPPPPGGRNLSLAVAVVVLAIAVVGAAVAIVLSRQGNSDAHITGDATTLRTVTTPGTATTTAGTPGHGVAEGAGTGTTATNPTGSTTSTASTTPTSSTTPTASAAPTTAGAGPLPGVSAQQMQSEIQQMLLEWHEDVVQGNYHAAWELLSRRKQAQDSSEYGYSTWAKNQATLRPYLNPSGIRVAVERTEPSSGVAQVDVTGMTWDKPDAPCTEWSGITWVKYENGGWKYDPGYTTTPQREREWKSRFSELLGGQC